LILQNLNEVIRKMGLAELHIQICILSDGRINDHEKFIVYERVNWFVEVGGVE